MRSTRYAIGLLSAVLVLVLFLVPAVQAAADTDAGVAGRTALTAKIDAWIQPFVERGDLSGNLLVAKGGDVVYERSFGMANYELGVPVRPETRFNVASVTKPMTVIALIQLATEGKLTLEDKLSKYIPDFPRGDDITVEHLARHRAGIPHRVTESWQETVPRTAADMVEFAKQKPRLGEPGERSVYSSGGFSVLARVLELASGQTYEELLESTVFGPAGMTHSVHTDSRTILEGRADGYFRGPEGEIVNAPLQDLSFLVGAGSVYSTARDLYTLMNAVREGKFEEGVQQSFVDDNGLDWNGVTNGFRAFADWHRASDVSVVLVANLQTGAANRIRKDLHRVVAGEQVPLPTLPDVKMTSIPEKTRRGWEGVYELRPGSPLRVEVDGRGMRANAWVLIPVGERRFYSPQDYAFVDVIVDDAGRPLRLDWGTDGKPLACPRIADLDAP